MAYVSGELHLKIREERIKQGLSQKKLGEMVNLPQQAINRIEQGKRKLDIELFEKLCNVLDIKKIGNFDIKFVSSFYKMDDELEIDQSNEKYLLDTFRQLNTTGQKKVIEHTEMLIKIPEYQKKESTL